MGFDWKKAEENGGAGETLAPGFHYVTGQRVKRIKDSGSGHPRIMLVVEDDDCTEATVNFTLSARASWFLVKWLSRCGQDLEELTNDGVEPRHFVNTDIAEKYLVGESTWIEVTANPENPKYPDVNPVKESEVPEKDRKLPPGRTDVSGIPLDDIPFVLLLVASLALGAVA